MEQITGELSYAKVTSLTFSGGSGALEVSFKMSRNSASGCAYAYVGRNGAQVGQTRSLCNELLHTWDEDISGWSSGDTVELWAKVGGSTSHVGEFRVRGGLFKAK